MELELKVRRELMDRLSASPSPLSRFRYNGKVIAWELTLRCTHLFKRCFDFLGSAFLLILLSPLFLLTAITIRIEDPGPVFYTQKRVGKNGKHFNFYKFRSMVIGADKMKDTLLAENESEEGVIFKMKDDPRITKTGKFIRKFSVDELPQLLNVLKGDMSLVGPRPALPREVALYTLDQRKRLHVQPGITCLWQVSGRSNIAFYGQVQLDLNYIQSQSFWNDIWILLKTIPAVLKGDGAY